MASTDEPEVPVAGDHPLIRPRPWRSASERFRAHTLDRLRPWIDWFGAGRLVGIVVTLACAAAAAWWLLRPSAPPTEATLPYASVVTTSPSATTAGGPPTGSTLSASPVVVHMAGAVVSPGVYELAAGARVTDGVVAAGGIAIDGDTAAVNLAARLVDGARVYVPRIGETPPPVVAATGAATGTAVPSGPVDLNQASAQQLDALPGIGPATAAAIVAHRDEHGPFAAVAQLEDVRGIGPSKVAALAGLVTT